MSRFRVGLAVVAMIVWGAVVPVVSTAGAGVAAAADPCTLPAPVGGVITLTASCSTTVPLTIPNGVRLNGAGFTITASDATPGAFSGAVLSNAGASMNIENLKIVGHFTFSGACSRAQLYGILFTNASGTVNNVSVTGITENSGCQVGTAIRANGLAAPANTVTITNTTVTDYDKNGLTGAGSFMTMNVSNSTIGPPASLVGTIAQNGAQWGGLFPGTHGSISNSTIYGSGDDVEGAGASGTAVLLFGAVNVTVSNNTTTGAGTDIGVAVTSDSTGIVIKDNHIGRPSPDSPDLDGIGISVDPSSATLICNTFSGWKTNIVGAVQDPCITTTAPPSGVVGTAYSTTLAACCGSAPYTFAIASGTLPPGLTLHSSGAISGTPTRAGTFAFTVRVVDSTGLAVTQAMSITIDPAPVTPASTPAAPVAPITSASVPVTG
jgi:hypothetical protein